MLPKQYEWLLYEGGPKMIIKALELFGTREIVGPLHNPVIMGWAKELGLRDYNADEIPWCGLFVAIVAHRAGKPVPVNPLWALNWASFGEPTMQPRLGDILTFTRNGGGHVGIYIGEDREAYHVLGGNQGDQVSIVRIAKSRLHVACKTPYVNQPANIRPVYLKPDGVISRNEA